MCLVTKQNEPLIAKEDIKCFKILKKSNNIFFKRFYSPFWHFRYKFNKMYKTNLNLSYDTNRCFLVYNEVEDGFHAFTNHSYAINAYFLNCLGKYIIVESVIPSGSEYYVSLDGTEIVSDQMKLIKIIK